ncbi:DUF4190 domain-containing protein [Microbispora sp. NBC_01189]|uniref:hypothetical protein n=1 Tax=Microbispora sp. NBC_01189 TaxID=2903583 RepID=UPI002E161F1E|nr:DUF4190 domain-containing protein [Microbispora sp. NBC_01189]
MARPGDPGPPPGPYGEPPYGGPLPPPPWGPGGPGGGPWGPGGPGGGPDGSPGGGLGTAALVLGICSLVLLLFCGAGTVLAVVGLVIGIVAITRNSNRGRATAGVVLNALTLVLALILGVVLYHWFQSRRLGECFDSRLYPTQQDARRCVDDRLGRPR